MRRTGRTFRQILRSILEMSEGKEVVLCVNNKDEVNRVFSSALSVLESYIPVQCIEIDSGRKKLRIQGSRGSMTVVDLLTVRAYEEGCQSHKRIYDLQFENGGKQ